MRFREIFTVAIVAGGLAAAATRHCAAQTTLPLQPVLDAAGNFAHDADVTSRVILVSSTGVLIECSQPKTAAHPAAIWRERYTILDGKIVLAAMITQRLVPPEAAHSEWEETTISHTPPEPKAKNPTAAIGIDTNSGSTNVGPTGFDPRWNGFSGYLNKMMAAVQAEWDHIRITNQVYPKSGTPVTVKFVLNSKGNVTRIVNVDTSPGTSDAAGRTCVAAITAHAPYGDWTEEMVATLGTDQEITLTFYYP
jgi:hypothetical protein